MWVEIKSPIASLERNLEEMKDRPAFRVKRFTEKPDEASAQDFVASGEYYWNGGIFVWQVATILSEMARQLPRLQRLVV